MTPETPDNDPFADLFSSLPTAPARTPEGRTTQPDGLPADPVPTSRRAARAQAEAAAATPAVRSTSPVSAPATNEGAPVSVTPQSSEPVQSAGATRVAPQPIEALFAVDPDDDDHSRHDRHQRDKRKSRIAGWVFFAVIVALIGGIVAAGFVVWTTYEDQIRSFMGWEEPSDYADGIAEGTAAITIISGDTGSSISRSLFEGGVTKTADAFYDYLISTGQNPVFQPGVYSLQQKMSSAAALAALKDPANRQDHTALLREGLTVEQSLPLLADGLGIPLEDLKAAVADPSVYGVSAQSLEGWLFPATYTFDPGTSAQEVIQALVTRTTQSLDKAGVPVERRQEILTIASIIQREARFEEDFFKVSRVIQNRLDESNSETSGKLQMDSTAQYGYQEMHDGTVSTSQEALDDPNPWNTYVHTGLPIGPIANPGDTAIDAAMHPADGPWMYFVTVNLDTGETVFTNTYAEHEKAVTQWQDWCEANPNSGC